MTATRRQPTIADHIEITPGVCGGKPRISGSRIRVQDIVVWHEAQRLSPDEIVSHYPTLTLVDVYAALAYYHDHRAEVRQQMAEDTALVETFKRECAAKILNPRKGRHGGPTTLSS